jgi:hypothetical protein
MELLLVVVGLVVVVPFCVGAALHILVHLIRNWAWYLVALVVFVCVGKFT